MVTRLWSSLNPDLEESPQKGSASSVSVVGLRILIELANESSDGVVLSSLKLKKPIFQTQPIDLGGYCDFSNNSFLKSCQLCNKNLSLDKEVFMYRGDQGFCSEECRSRQIYKDEKDELEVSTKKMLTSNRRRCIPSPDQSATRALLDEFRQRHKSSSMACHRSRARAIF